MALFILNTPDADLNKVQQNVKKELDALEAAIPTNRNPSTAINADYSVQLTDVLVLANPAADINVTMPAIGTCVGEEFTIKNVSSAAVVHVRGLYVNGAFQVIDGLAPYDVPSGTSITCYSDGFAWWIK